MTAIASYPVSGSIVGHVVSPKGMSIESAFWLFHYQNPHVYKELVRLTRELVAHGVERTGIKMLFEVMRWQHALKTGGDDFKLNNNYHSYYARLIMMREPDLVGVFETRKLHTWSASSALT